MIGIRIHHLAIPVCRLHFEGFSSHAVDSLGPMQTYAELEMALHG